MNKCHHCLEIFSPEAPASCPTCEKQICSFCSQKASDGCIRMKQTRADHVVTQKLLDQTK